MLFRSEKHRAITLNLETLKNLNDKDGADWVLRQTGSNIGAALASVPANIVDACINRMCEYAKSQVF